ncbi:hypothetical protein MA03_01820 [Infirmifilum uzonense]|uniref:Uncharacterized protein n=1 Tax=Infirmifilum uzonense TaxID=1550241 RepID=A0A0F7FHR8_9CREN|nr:hypothetical protein [Infirmifilum uzonense]AKG38275.1 hypothetical protein MA03_01820 [Infirmifilum uzonense]
MKACRYVLVLFITLGIIRALGQCLEPLDENAFEVVLNIPSIRLDTIKLSSYKEVSKIGLNVFAYRSGYDDRFAVVLSLQTIPGSSTPYPVLRVQLIDEASTVTYEDLRRVLGLELERLTKSGVLVGLNDSLKARIVSQARLGLAGWDMRLVWDDGQFKPYIDSSIYVPQRGCQLPLVTDYSKLPVWSSVGEGAAWNPIFLGVFTGLLLISLVFYFKTRKRLSMEALKKT